jgi:hypothetical protein
MLPLGDCARVLLLQVHVPPALPSRAMLELVSAVGQCMRLAPLDPSSKFPTWCCARMAGSSTARSQDGLQLRVRCADIPLLTNLQAHDPKYVERFCGGALDDNAVKRIGFGAVTRSPVLVERTLAEVAGGQHVIHIVRFP